MLGFLPGRHQARVGDDDIQAFEAVRGPGRCAREIGLPDDIAAMLDPAGRQALFAGFGIEADARCAGFAEASRDGMAETVGGAGDQGDLAAEIDRGHSITVNSIRDG